MVKGLEHAPTAEELPNPMNDIRSRSRAKTAVKNSWAPNGFGILLYTCFINNNSQPKLIEKVPTP